MTRLSIVGLVLGAVAVATACSSSSVTDASQAVGPGSKALLSDTVVCAKTSDCATGEQCVDGTCQIQRCAAGDYRSASPLGARSYFTLDRELVVVDGTRGIDGYEPTDSSFAHPSSLHLDFGGVTILDEVGGQFTGTRPEGVAIAVSGRSSVTVTTGPSTSVDVPVGFQPIAVASGDTDGDGTDELVALSAAGDVAICQVATAKCTAKKVTGISAKDIAMGDVDGDGTDEPVVLGDKGGSSHLVVLNLDSAATGQPEQVDTDTKHTAFRVTVGDVDGTAPAEIVTLEDGGYLGYVNDTVRIFQQKDTGFAEVGSVSPAADTLDVFAGDIDGDRKAEILVLEGSGVEVLDGTSLATPRSSFKTALTSSLSPTRIAMADLDGDSPVGTLQGNPELVAGPVVPVSVLVYPPYSTTHSDGTSEIGLGNTESKGDVASTTVTLNAAFVLGYDAEIPGIAKVGIQAGVNTSVVRTSAKSHGVTIGDKFSVTARPDLEGPDNGVAVLACACYHAYTYAIDDPAGKLGDRAADKKTMSLFVPVGGQTALWSLKRYNALANRLGNLPTVSVPYIVGDPTSYPKKLSTLSGAPIPEEDMLFTTPKSYRTSDVAKVGWSLAVSDGATNTNSLSLGVTLRGILKAGPVVAETTVGASSANAYSVTVGREASFSGTVPPVRNDVRTPEDENALYGFGFSPIVYREHYTNKDGNEGGLFVVTYSVTP